MLKEIILAAFIGGILGLGITGGYLTMQHKDQPSNKNESVITEPTLIPTSTDQSPNEEKNDSIKIISPENNALVSTEKTTITGNTSPNSNIIVVTSTNTFTNKSDDKGNFGIPITLDSGLNIIKISSIDSDNNQKDISINITYSTAKI